MKKTHTKKEILEGMKKEIGLQTNSIVHKMLNHFPCDVFMATEENEEGFRRVIFPLICPYCKKNYMCEVTIKERPDLISLKSVTTCPDVKCPGCNDLNLMTMKILVESEQKGK